MRSLPPPFSGQGRPASSAYLFVTLCFISLVSLFSPSRAMTKSPAPVFPLPKGNLYSRVVWVSVLHFLLKASVSFPNLSIFFSRFPGGPIKCNVFSFVPRTASLNVQGFLVEFDGPPRIRDFLPSSPPPPRFFFFFSPFLG